MLGIDFPLHLDNLDNQATAQRDIPPPPPPGGECEHLELWLARDGKRRCLNCEPPMFAGEVVPDPVPA